mgnify:FL=1
MSEGSWRGAGWGGPTVARMAPGRTLQSGPYAVDFHELYERMWIAAEDLGDGSRLYVSYGNAALKWLIAELAGTPAEAGRALPDNSAIRGQMHALLIEEGWADRINQRSFRLLVRPNAVTDHGVAEYGTPPLLPAGDPEDEGVCVEDVPLEQVTDDAGTLVLGGVEWSDWTPLADASRSASQGPGVYVARVRERIVYVGMVGERRGKGIRGRLSVYARGRGAVSGLGEAVLDRALADPDWVAQQLHCLREQGPRRAKAWAMAAFDREPLDVPGREVHDSRLIGGWPPSAVWRR